MAKEDEAQGAADAGGEPKRRFSSRRLLLFVILPLLLLLAGGGAYYYFFIFSKKPAAEAAKPAPPPKKAFFYNLPEFLVNLPTTSGHTSFLKLSISLELDSAAEVTPVQSRMPRIVDHVQAYLRELRPEDLRGTAALNRLRQEILDRVHDAAPNAKVDGVLLQELLLQ